MDTDPISGEWEATITTPEWTRSVRLILMLDGAEVSGRLESDGGAQSLNGGTWSQDQLTLSVPSDQGEMELSGKLNGTQLAGGINLADGAQGSWQAIRM